MFVYVERPKRKREDKDDRNNANVDDDEAEDEDTDRAVKTFKDSKSDRVPTKMDSDDLRSDKIGLNSMEWS